MHSCAPARYTYNMPLDVNLRAVCVTGRARICVCPHTTGVCHTYSGHNCGVRVCDCIECLCVMPDQPCQHARPCDMVWTYVCISLTVCMYACMSLCQHVCRTCLQSGCLCVCLSGGMYVCHGGGLSFDMYECVAVGCIHRHPHC